MLPEDLTAAQEWLARAERDLAVAASTLRGDDVFPEAAAFHSQQAAGKAMKAYLVAHGQPFPKTHDLEQLRQWCESIDGEFARFVDAASILTPYAVRFRYPIGPLMPEMADAQEAIRLAGEVVEFVHSRLFPAE